MPQINVLNILQGDNQSTIVDKINYNFDQILSAGGGPQGQKGSIGATGPVGPQGPQGVQGSQGPSGSKWFVQDVTPALGSIAGSNPFLFPTLGDYWLDPASSDQDIYVYTSTGWADTGFGLAAGDIFQNLAPISIAGGGASQNAIMIAGASEDSSLVLSDSTISQYTPVGTPIENLNYENSKLKISTKDARTKLISFGHSDFDIDPGGSAGSNSNYNPYFSWRTSFPGKGYWDLKFINPTGSILIESPGLAANSGINLLSTAEISAQTTSSSILLRTDAVDKGTYVDASSGSYGFFEVGDSSKGTNLLYPFLYVNSTGLGVGIGTGGFKLTGDDSRRLSVLGNVSVSKTASEHTANMFTGNASWPNNNNKGAFYVEGHAGFGRINPTGYEGGSVNITGPAESVGLYPQVWVSSPNYGPALQIKNLGTATSTTRTIIGDGNIDSGSIVTPTDRVSGVGPDITQEFFSNGYTFPLGPVLSYQHKITNSTNTTATANVFAITTNVNAGAYNASTSVSNTTIQTRNSNARLILEANSTGQYDSNRISLGSGGHRYLASFPGPQGSSMMYGTTTIGSMRTSTNPRGLTGNLSSLAEFANVSLPTFDGTSGGWNQPNHALSVVGVQTIGTTDPVSLLQTDKTATGDFGAVSMLKIHRNLGSATYVPSGSFPTGLTGTYPNNYANGLEITSFKSVPAFPSKGNENKSVALAIGATNLTSRSGGLRTTCPATGFYVSDTGEQVAIGSTIDSTVGLSVTAPSVSLNSAIIAYGDVNVTGGNLNVTGGNLNVSGDVAFTLPEQFTSDAPGATASTSMFQNRTGFSFAASGPKGSASVVITAAAVIVEDLEARDNVKIVNGNGYESPTWTRTAVSNQSGANSLIFDFRPGTNGTDELKIGMTNNTYANTVTSVCDFDTSATQYDRIIYGYDSGADFIGSQCQVLISIDSGANYRLIVRGVSNGRSGRNTVSFINAIIPAGALLKLRFTGTERWDSGFPELNNSPTNTGSMYCWIFTMVKFGL